MVNHSTNTFMLLTLGAGFLAYSFNKGRVGELKKSILFAALAFFFGMIKIVDDSSGLRSNKETLVIVFGYALLSFLAVFCSRRLYLRQKKPKNA